MRKTVQEVVDEYIVQRTSRHVVQDTSKELEVKFYLDDFDNYFKKLYQAILNKSDAKIEQILNTITDVGVNTTNKHADLHKKQITERKELWFVNGAKSKEENIRKSKEAFTHGKLDSLRYQVAFATETKIQQFNTGSANGMRLKFRSSLILKDELPNWRFDFTIVRTVERNEFTNIKSIIDEFFVKRATPETFLDQIPETVVHNIHPELEVEFVGSDTTDMAEQIESVVRFVAQTTQSDTIDRVYQTALGWVADLIIPDKNYAKTFYTKNTLKQLANNPRSFDFATYRNYIVPNIEDFYLSDKADGDRCFIVAKPNEPITYLTTDTLTTGPMHKSDRILIMDAELLSSGVAMVFDLIYDNTLAAGLSFGERLTQLEAVVKEFGKSLKLEMKPQVKLTSKFASEIEEMYNNKSRGYPIDGLIFTPDKGYGAASPEKLYGKHIHYFDMTVYKWKPQDRQTVDFLIMRAPKSALGVEPFMTKENHELMFLFCGISRAQFRQLGLSEPRGYEEIFGEWNLSPTFFPAAFMPSSNPLAYMWYRSLDGEVSTSSSKKDTKAKSKTKSESEPDISGHVGEFSYRDGAWALLKMRPDRDTQVAKGIGYGNAYKTAEMTFEGYRDPLTLEKLMHPENTAYFATGKTDRYKAPTRFNAFVKAQMIRQLAGSNMIIDLAAGKGQDLFTIHGMGIKNVLFVDKDQEALVELNNRKYNLGDRKYYVFDFKPAKTMNIWTASADLTMDANKIISSLEQYSIKPGTVDGIIMNFAIHYIIKDDASLANLIELVNHYLKPGGLFIFTCFDGNRVFDFLRATQENHTIDLIDPGEQEQALGPKYSIKKLFREKTFKPYGMEVSVIHPFSAGEYYTENLVGIEWVLEKFKALNYTILQNSSFGDWLDRFNQSDRKLKLTDSDKIYVSLYSYITVAKAFK